MGRLQREVLLIAGLLVVSQARVVVGRVVAGRRDHAAADLIRDTLRRLTDRADREKSGMCIIQNYACKDSEGKALKSFSNINNQEGCDEKCSETDDCKW